MGWRVIGEGRSFADNEDMERETERAYREGCQDGYEKAMKEIEEESFGERGGSYDTGDYSDGSFGQRRGVRGTGPYSRVRRRRYY